MLSMLHVPNREKTVSKRFGAPNEYVYEDGHGEFVLYTECIWTDTGDDYATWDTTCGRSFCMIDDTPKKNDYNFCPGCGGKLFEVPQVKP